MMSKTEKLQKCIYKVFSDRSDLMVNIEKVVENQKKKYDFRPKSYPKSIVQPSHRHQAAYLQQLHVLTLTILNQSVSLNGAFHVKAL